MIEIVGKDGLIYNIDVRCPASEVDGLNGGRRHPASDTQERFLLLLDALRFDEQPLKRAPRIIP